MVVAVSEGCCRHSYGVAKDSLSRVAATVDLRLNFFDNDSPTAFDRFHITQIFGVSCMFRCYAAVLTSCASIDETKAGDSLEDAYCGGVYHR